MPTLVRFTAIRANARIILAPEIRAMLDEYVRGFMADIVIEVSQYPPPPPSPPNRYVRTGRLLRNWRVRPIGNPDQIAYQIDNPVQDRWGRYYVSYVVGPSGQTSFHAAHGWKNIRDYVHQDEFRAGAQAVISRGAA